jgi:uncharacterized protein (TIGR03067 family)
MKTLVSIFLAAASLGAAAAVMPGDDAAAMQGNWKPVRAELGGAPLPDAVLKLISLKLENGKYEVLVGDAPDKGNYTLDSGANPKGITVTGTAGPNVGQTFPSIYELNGDTLRICYDLSGAKRPTEFKTAAGTKLYLVTYVRQAATSPEQQIIALERQWAFAIQKQDAAAMSRFLSENYFLAIGAQGGALRIVPKAAWLANLKTYVTSSFNFDDIQVHVYEKTAIVLMLFSQQATVNGQDRSAQFVITDVWVNEPTGWRVAERHSSRPEPAR